MPLKVLHVVGARPNFMKATPVTLALARRDVEQVLVHTGQHYDANMSEIFFKQLGLAAPDINLEVGSGSHAMQTAQIMTCFEPIVLEQRPDWVLVYGDVNSTVATTMVSVKLGFRVAHVEAGLRSFDRRMPEEINRLLTDQISDLLFTPSSDGNQNLQREGVADDKVHLVGNVMIDTLVRLLPQVQALAPLDRLGLAGVGGYGLVTLHRPSNVDDEGKLLEIMTVLRDLSDHIPLLFPVHPRTRTKLNAMKFVTDGTGLHLLSPLGYLDFLALQKDAALVITDSGGIQEETTYLNVPCLTLRENTERPITVEQGTNVLIGGDLEKLKQTVHTILRGQGKQGSIPLLWDGAAAERIAEILLN